MPEGEPKPENKSEKINVETEIALIRQQCAVMGANDSEFNELDNILKAWYDQKISDQEAIFQAREVLARKQNYH